MKLFYITANAGGLLGLCMGFSFLSIVEILYFATLRLICSQPETRCEKIKHNRQKKICGKGYLYPFIK